MSQPRLLREAANSPALDSIVKQESPALSRIGLHSVGYATAVIDCLARFLESPSNHSPNRPDPDESLTF